MAAMTESSEALNRDYALEAEREATESGMAIQEYQAVLKGAVVTALIPPKHLEGIAAYGVRAVGEVLVRYLVGEAER
ncbi:hypothetical protein [Methylobacterium brachythecii]|uniref:hypothetical protein n=1 Tax=Methylobacterium brachythecii TaxID=1176177 RepID=UPI00160EF485|nr:hypothetical protein [Methylobacterium brachythecii]